jgi:hypothetical protein
MTNKQKYQEYCKIEFSVPVFSQPFWLDAVCGEENWDVVLHEESGEIVVSMPYYIKKRYGIPYITQPRFTQTLGPCIKYPDGLTHEEKLTYEKAVMNSIIEQLEMLKVVSFQQNFSFKIDNWMPFYWKGYKQTTNYTYRINDISDFDKVLRDFHKSKKRYVKYARSEMLHIDYDMSAQAFYDYHKSVLNKSGKRITYELSLLLRVVKCTLSNSCGRIINVADENGNIHGAIFIIWDKMSSYNLMTAFDPDFKNYHGSSLLFYETIKFVSKYVNSFDFEGSMIESVENAYRKFGTIQTPYFCIWKTYTRNPFLKLIINSKLRK